MKLRAKAAARAIRAGASYVGPLVFVAGIAVCVPIAAVQGYRHVVSTPYFALTDLRVEGVKRLDRAAVLTQAEIGPDTNAFDADPQRIEQLVGAMPWVRAVRVERRLPRTLEISVEEHVAAAVLVDSGTYTLVGVSGQPFKDLTDEDPVDELLQLPLITGLSRAEATTDAGRDLVMEAIDVVRLADEQGLPTLSEVHVDPVMGISIVPADSGAQVRLGRGRYAERLQRLRAVFAALQRDGQQADYILIDGEEKLDRVTVGPRRLGDAPKESAHE